MTFLLLIQDQITAKSLQHNLNVSSHNCLGVLNELGDVKQFMEQEPNFVLCCKEMEGDFKQLYNSNAEWRKSVLISVEENSGGGYYFENLEGMRLELATSSTTYVVDELIASLCSTRKKQTIFNYGM